MRIGMVFPQAEIGPDPGAVRAIAQAAEELGYAHLLAYDHVLGAGLRNRPDFRGPYTSDSLFHEVFVLFGYLAGVTERLELVSGVIILPQRQTALVAKQAAEVDVLSGGRLRLGVGVGWNDVEFTGLNENFRNRGRRCEEQIALMRALWTDEVVDFEGRWHRIPEAGINPLPGAAPDSGLDRRLRRRDHGPHRPHRRRLVSGVAGQRGARGESEGRPRAHRPRRAGRGPGPDGDRHGGADPPRR